MSTSAASRFSRSNTKSTPVEWCKSTDIGKLRRSADVYRSDGFITIPPVQNWSTSAPDHGLGVGGRFLIGSVRLPQRNPWNIVRGKPVCKQATPILKTVHEPRHTGAGIQRSGSASSARARRVAADRNDATCTARRDGSQCPLRARLRAERDHRRLHHRLSPRTCTTCLLRLTARAGQPWPLVRSCPGG